MSVGRPDEREVAVAESFTALCRAAEQSLSRRADRLVPKGKAGAHPSEVLVGEDLLQQKETDRKR